MYFVSSWRGRDSAQVTMRLPDGTTLRRTLAQARGEGYFYGARFHESGQPRTALRLRDGLPHRTFTRFDDAGDVVERGELRAGEREGLWFLLTNRDRAGVRASYSTYRAGQQESTRTYAGADSLAPLVGELTYDRGELTAPSYGYYDDGHVELRISKGIRRARWRRRDRGVPFRQRGRTSRRASRGRPHRSP